MGTPHGQPSAAPRPGTELAQDSASSGLPTVLIVLLVALVLAAATGGATAIGLHQRRRSRPAVRRRACAPAPARRPAGRAVQPDEELNGPRYR